MQTEPNVAPAGQRATALIVRLMVVIVAMFAFGYALIPMYRAICRITGINSATPYDPDAAAFAKSTQVDLTRSIHRTVRRQRARTVAVQTQDRPDDGASG